MQHFTLATLKQNVLNKEFELRKKMRGDGPYVMSSIRHGLGVLRRFVVRALQPDDGASHKEAASTPWEDRDNRLS